jgi:hypothetical protein
MGTGQKHLKSAHAAGVFFFLGLLVGSICGVFVLSESPAYEPALVILVAGGVIGLTTWVVLLLIDCSRTRNERFRRQRTERGLRSPWGELRTEEPRPYSDRLAHYLSHALERDKPPALSADSHMRFWALFDWPTESTGPKPPWFIRRILRRIQEAVRG